MRKSFFSKVGNKFVISEEGQEVIKSTFIIPFSETGNRKPAQFPKIIYQRRI